MKKRYTWLSALLAAALLLGGCGAAAPEPEPTDPAAETAPVQATPEVLSEGTLPKLTKAEPAEWTVYWYLCGSNLESFYGCASNDLAEAMSVQLPDNVRVVIECGGSFEWHNENVSAGEIERFVLDSSGLTLVDRQPEADMGEAQTLVSFLSFCDNYFPSEHSMMLFWNHGGGSVAGAAFDETYSYDALTLMEFAAAFDSVYPDRAEPPFDVIGFDTCLMSTIDVANTFKDVARYMVASEEVEPGCGWYYTGWLGALAKDPKMDAQTLGRIICDTYVEGCRNEESDYEITLALTDLGALGGLTEAYDALGSEALLAAVHDPDFFGIFGRAARDTENYGGNTREQGYTNMVDLGHLVHNCAEIFPESSAKVLEAIDSCVVYKVNGPYRAEATGLSCYYSYNADLNNFVEYTLVGASEAFKYLYGYGLTGQLSDAGMEYIKVLMPEEEAEKVPEGAAAALMGTSNEIIRLYDPSFYDDPNEDDWLVAREILEEQRRLEEEEEQRRLEEEEEQRRLQEEEQRRLQEEEEQRRLAEEQQRLEEEQRKAREAWLRAQAAREEEERNRLFQPITTVDDFDPEDDLGAYVNTMGMPVLELNPSLAAGLVDIRVKVRQICESADGTGKTDFIDWGETELTDIDWDKGIAYSWFNGYWAALDGHALKTEIYFSSEDYILFSSPILLNGEACNLHIACDRNPADGESGWHILGARKPIDPETGMAEKYLYRIKPGDEIIPLYSIRRDVDDPESEWTDYDSGDKVIYKDESQLDLLTDFGDSAYEIQYEIIDSRNQIALSDSFIVRVSGERVATQLWKEFRSGLKTAVERDR